MTSDQLTLLQSQSKIRHMIPFQEMTDIIKDRFNKVSILLPASLERDSKPFYVTQEFLDHLNNKCLDKGFTITEWLNNRGLKVEQTKNKLFKIFVA